jgi:hypothetical protein
MTKMHEGFACWDATSADAWEARVSALRRSLGTGGEPRAEAERRDAIVRFVALAERSPGLLGFKRLLDHLERAVADPIVRESEGARAFLDRMLELLRDASVAPSPTVLQILAPLNGEFQGKRASERKAIAREWVRNQWIARRDQGQGNKSAFALAIGLELRKPPWCIVGKDGQDGRRPITVKTITDRWLQGL